MTAGHSSNSATPSWVYAVHYRDQEGADIGSLAVEPDFAPACEGAVFHAIRRGIVPPILAEGRARVVPVWDGELGAPILSAARVIVSPDVGGNVHCRELSKGCEGGGDAYAGRADPGAADQEAVEEGAVCEDIPAQAEFFRQLAKKGSEKMVERGALSQGQPFRFHVAAYAVEELAAADSDPAQEGFDFEEDDEPLPLRERDIAEFAANARPAGFDADASDMRTFVPQSVLDQTFQQADGSGENEVGGFLLGHLERTPGSPDIFLRVTAQVPARYTDATNASLTFTSDTWTAVRNAVELRGRGELLVGWWHKHPNFALTTCAKCPEERRRSCPMSKPFFSATDIHMHRTVFPRAYQTALLLSDLGEPSFDVRFYGWRKGSVVSRGFEVVPR